MRPRLDAELNDKDVTLNLLEGVFEGTKLSSSGPLRASSPDEPSTKVSSHKYIEPQPNIRVDVERALGKRAIRALGIAESFRLSHPRSVFAGVVMRSDWFIDGVGVEYSTVGGLDATEAVLRLVDKLSREDVHVIMVDGCIVSYYNFVRIREVYERTGIPVMCLVFEKVEGKVDKAVRMLFEDYEVRLKAVEELGEPMPVETKGGIVWVRPVGLELRTARRLLDKFTRIGKRPEPIRVAKLIARAVLTRLLHP